MSAPAPGLPVRLAETINHLAAPGTGRLPAVSRVAGLGLVTLGDRSLVARTHGERVTRRGRQTLVSVHGRLTWVASHRVQPLGGPDVGTPASAAGAGVVAADSAQALRPTQQAAVAEGDLA